MYILAEMKSFVAGFIQNASWKNYCLLFHKITVVSQILYVCVIKAF